MTILFSTGILYIRKDIQLFHMTRVLPVSLQLISKGLWPPKSPDLSPSQFFFLLYSNPPHTGKVKGEHTEYSRRRIR